MQDEAIFVVLAGLPGTGKSSIAREAARRLGAVWLRIDSIEQAIRASGVAHGSVGDAGYRAAYALANDNLRLGNHVVGDSVNPWMLTRNAWREIGVRAGARVVEVETICSNLEEHRRRVETRASEIPGHVLPGWAEVLARDYHSWDRDHLVIDTASLCLEACVEQVLVAVG